MPTPEVYIEFFGSSTERTVHDVNEISQHLRSINRAETSIFGQGRSPGHTVVLISIDLDYSSVSYPARITLFRHQGETYNRTIQAVLFSPTFDRMRDGLVRNESLVLTYQECVSQLGEFVVVLNDRSAYFMFFNMLGPTEGLSLLSAVNDLATLKYQGVKRGLTDRMLRVPSLVNYLNDSTEAYSLVTALWRILEPSRARTGPAPDFLCFDFRPSSNHSVEFEFDFKRNLKGAQAINAIIGPNGVGKTRALISFANTVKREGGSWPAKSIIYTHDLTAFQNRLAKGNQLLSLKPSKSSWRGVIEKLVNLLVQESPNHLPYDLLERLLIEVLPLSNLYFPINTGASESLQLLDRSETFGGHHYISASVLKDPDLVNPLLFRLDVSPVIRNADNSFAMPSSGEMALFTFIVSILSECEQGSLVLIDEPENHLHPQFITLLMSALSKVLVDTDSRAIVVTHSPYVIRELDKSAVTIVKRDSDGNVDLYMPTLQTHGSGISEISSYVFDDDNIRKAYEHIIDIIVKNAPERKGSDLQKLIGAAFGEDAITYFVSRYESKLHH